MALKDVSLLTDTWCQRSQPVESHDRTYSKTLFDDVRVVIHVFPTLEITYVGPRFLLGTSNMDVKKNKIG